jgi:glutamate-5-semialdehyde dehydrogenase
MIDKICSDAIGASHTLAMLSSAEKNEMLSSLAEELSKAKDAIYCANEIDLRSAEMKGKNKAFLQRLAFGKKELDETIEGIEQVIALDDPIGKVIEEVTIVQGMQLQKVTVPLGVIMIIYEARPNVTIDVSALCIKSGNAAILKGGSQALNTNLALYECLQKALTDSSMVQFVKDRETSNALMLRHDAINLLIPRGGKDLIDEVLNHSKIPVIKNYQGICNIYVDRYADFEKARRIIVNAKVQKPSACNSVENLIVHESIMHSFLPVAYTALTDCGVEIVGCDETRKVISVGKATEEDYKTEYLDLKLSVKVVKNLDEAISFIARYGSGHSDAIITEDELAAETFLRRVDSAAVYHNASTRFTDGGQFGMGCEIGISTDKLHARGPMGLRELTSYKSIVRGNGQVRQ